MRKFRIFLKYLYEKISNRNTGKNKIIYMINLSLNIQKIILKTNYKYKSFYNDKNFYKKY